MWGLDLFLICNSSRGNSVGQCHSSSGTIKRHFNDRVGGWVLYILNANDVALIQLRPRATGSHLTHLTHAAITYHPVYCAREPRYSSIVDDIRRQTQTHAAAAVVMVVERGDQKRGEVFMASRQQSVLLLPVLCSPKYTVYIVVDNQTVHA